MKTKKIKVLAGVFSVIFWILLWHFVSTKIGKSIILPSPRETMSVFFSLLFTKEFWNTCLTSLKSIFSGALLGVMLGSVIAYLSYKSLFLKYLFSPLLSLAKATPVASFIILLLVWIGREWVPFTISLMMVTPIVSSNLFEGLCSINKELREVVISYEIKPYRAWKLLYRQSIMPYFLSAIKSGLAIAWKAGIAGEVLCTPKSTIGLKLHESRIYLEVPELFAWTLVVILLSFLVEVILVTLSRALLGGEKNVNKA